jgi:hypothetical protein
MQSAIKQNLIENKVEEIKDNIVNNQLQDAIQLDEKNNSDQKKINDFIASLNNIAKQDEIRLLPYEEAKQILEILLYHKLEAKQIPQVCKVTGMLLNIFNKSDLTSIDIVIQLIIDDACLMKYANYAINLIKVYNRIFMSK